jgi:hypothetical protein
MTPIVNGAFGRRVAMAFALAMLLAPARAVAQDTTPAVPPPAGQQGLFPEPGIIERAIDKTTRAGDIGGEKTGFYFETSHMITGAGWISLGPGYRYWLAGDRMFVDASAAISWRKYMMARAQFELPKLAGERVAVGTELRWQDFTQNTHFGDGADSLETDRSQYRVKSTNAIAYTNVRPVDWLTVGGRAGWLYHPTLLPPSGSFRRDLPATAERFPGFAAFALDEQPSFAHGEASIAADTRDYPGFPHHGFLYRGSWSVFSDRDHGNFSFQRFEAEGAQFVSFADDLVTLAMHGWLVASDTAAGKDIPFYLMPALGGNNSLRAYANYRFHDRHLVMATVETRLALFEHVDLAVFADAGNVAARMADLNLDRTSFGAGLRLHSDQSTLGRVDLAHGREGWRVTVNTSDMLRLTRLSRRTAPIPFVP